MSMGKRSSSSSRPDLSVDSPERNDQPWCLVMIESKAAKGLEKVTKSARNDAHGPVVKCPSVLSPLVPRQTLPKRHNRLATRDAQTSRHAGLRKSPSKNTPHIPSHSAQIPSFRLPSKPNRPIGITKCHCLPGSQHERATPHSGSPARSESLQLSLEYEKVNDNSECSRVNSNLPSLSLRNVMVWQASNFPKIASGRWIGQRHGI